MPADFTIVIPARYGSTRLPGKPLLELGGKPMIAHVCERALEAGAAEVVVATDDARIAEAVDGLPVTAMLTRTEHASGTERLAEVAERRAWSDDTLVVNLQGDEPFMDAALLRALAEALGRREDCRVATLAAPIHRPEEIFDPNVVKVVTDGENRALYFSRAAVPWDRESFAEGAGVPMPGMPYRRHIGVYAYTASYLRRYVDLEPSPLEHVERLEQLRILWHGDRILVVPVEGAPAPGVDTAADLERARRHLSGRAP
ncbi:MULTISPECIES: 3-deoxy-manno-octulosonate cytidylyltransferase [Methylococcus]|jgi:3-deoxy-manno-octulosonate cytidylyltransferase (CMP-KDO synthetase)|uniref:3-deoxy-manno-octulosonate cytidylyltransferase n=1 Tax=Methylococcus capsulatus TaxID=414 RepID=A0AA35UT13_METCP|nr:3-deoxy-manno-octulosonate cytidylyltransferase [Methylococcus capsulatus]QXP90080.1 3-deoxy-manno-octulosonate cytidylyltransferase [Methylococcus capsulatus]CAI8754565.1 3-deoxy-manno-octulosonate cytidylyltransferase [Methylococcus capsulatus]